MEMRRVEWGTWEELVLGGAVLRHGVRAWDAVAAELRARTLYPYSFTAEVCKAKYEDLQERYCGRIAWFDELRKQRVAELKRELEKSEDSIGSLESKLESLKAERAADGIARQFDSTSHTESPASVGNSDGVDLSGKETSKDGLSAGSFTEETRTNWSPESQIPVPASTHEIEIKDIERENATSVQIVGGTVRKRRGKRKRKECSKEVKEGSVGDNDVGTSFDQVVEDRDVEESTGDIDRTVRSSYEVADRVEDLIRVLNSVDENENASTFRRRLDNQKRARYKKIIRRHLDFETIRSRISDRSITSARELHRDLLLLCNNALVFYPKDSREHKSAASLRDLVKKTFRKNQRASRTGSGGATNPQAEQPACNPPVKPRSARPCNRKVNGTGKFAMEVIPTPPESKKAFDADIPADSRVVAGKKGVDLAGKGGRRGGRRGPAEPATKGGKRIRRKSEG